MSILRPGHTQKAKNKNKKYRTMSKKTKETPILADEALGKSEAFIIKYKNIIIAAVSVVILAVAGVLAYNTFVVEPKEQEADKALAVAAQYFVDGKYAESLDGDGVNLGTIAICDEYSGTNAGNLASMYAGLALAKQEKYAEAIEYLEDFEADDAIVAPKVKHALGNCYAHTGDNEKAIDLLLDAAEEANNEAVTPFCWRDVAAMYEQEGKSAEAVELYEKIKAEYPRCILVTDGEIDRQLNSVK